MPPSVPQEHHHPELMNAEGVEMEAPSDDEVARLLCMPIFVGSRPGCTIVLSGVFAIKIWPIQETRRCIAEASACMRMMRHAIQGQSEGKVLLPCFTRILSVFTRHCPLEEWVRSRVPRPHVEASQSPAVFRSMPGSAGFVVSVMEKIPRCASLEKFLETRMNHPHHSTKHELRSILFQVLLHLSHLHQICGVSHNDIHLGNVMVAIEPRAMSDTVELSGPRGEGKVILRRESLVRVSIIDHECSTFHDQDTGPADPMEAIYGISGSRSAHYDVFFFLNSLFIAVLQKRDVLGIRLTREETELVSFIRRVVPGRFLGIGIPMKTIEAWGKMSGELRGDPTSLCDCRPSSAGTLLSKKALEDVDLYGRCILGDAIKKGFRDRLGQILDQADRAEDLMAGRIDCSVPVEGGNEKLFDRVLSDPYFDCLLIRE